MSRTLDVIRNRNKVEKELRKRKQNEIVRLRRSTSFRASASEFFKGLNALLEDETVENITIEIDDKDISNFGRILIESHDLDAFDIKQVKGKPNQFIVSKKYITL